MKKIITIILDGFGMREEIYGNAVKMAGMNNFINLWNKYPHCLLKSSEENIGLKKGMCGSSELGHKIIGSGRIVDNRFQIVNEMFKKNKLRFNEKFIELTKYLKSNPNKSLHISIMMSNGGISSSVCHLENFINELKQNKIKNNVYIHAISDGQDSRKNSIKNYIDEYNKIFTENIHFASICGRYYALDATDNYKRTKYFYDLLFAGKGIDSIDIKKIIDLCYNKHLTDEYIPPLKTTDFQQINNGDILMLLNTSTRNQYQLLRSICDKDFIEFNPYPNKPIVYSLYPIDKELNQNYMLEVPSVENTLCEYLSNLDINQARIYEKSKKEYVTYYLDGERKIEIKNCDDYEVETKDVERFDIKPEMNSLGVAKAAIKCMEEDYDFIICNFANPDMVGHTGNYQAIINGLQAIDLCLGKVVEFAEENFYKVIILGSHANVDTVIDTENHIMPKNTTSPVPLIIMDKNIKLKNGSLPSFTPTLLKYMDIKIPKEMKETDILIQNKK